MQALRSYARRTLEMVAPNVAHKRKLQYAARGERELTILPLLCRSDRVAVDIGANRGLYVEHLLRVTPHVVAFEPLPEMQRMLKRFYGSRIRLEPFALSDSDGTAEIRLPSENTSWATLAKTNRLELSDASRQIQQRQVATRALDSFALNNVDLIKIDVEGHEEAVLRGALGTIARERPNLIIEVEERHNIGSVARVHALMRSLGYAGYFLSGPSDLQSSIQFEQDRDQNIKNVGEGGRLGRYINNFVFVPNERAATVEHQIRMSS